MLGLSRLAYSLATNRQIPSALGRLHPTRATPFVVIVIAALARRRARRPRGPRLPRRHLRVRRAARVHARAPLDHRAALPRARPRRGPTAMPLSIRVRRRRAAAAGGARRAAVAAPRWVSVRRAARGRALRRPRAGWLGGLALYVVYRRTDGKPVFKRVTVPERGAAARAARAPSTARSSCRSSARRSTTTSSRPPAGWPPRSATSVDEEGATIEALWVFEVPMSLPIDARLPERAAQSARGGAAARQGGGGGVRGRRGRDRDGPRAPRRPGDRRGGAPARRRGDRAGRRGALAHPRRRAARRPRRPARQLRRRGHEVRGEQGAVPRDPHRAAGAREPRRPPERRRRGSGRRRRRASVPRMFILDRRRRPRRLRGRQARARGRPRGVRARRGPALARAARQGLGDDAGRTPAAASPSARRSRSTR